MSKFKVGDRVRIVSLQGYGHSESQGLFIGNTGVVKTLFGPGAFGIATDNASNEYNRATGTGEGWYFNRDSLALTRRPLLSRLAFWRKAA